MPAKAVPTGDGWLHEMKFDGYRVQAHKISAPGVVYSRNGHDFTDRFPSIAQLLRELSSSSARRRGRGQRCRRSSELRQTARALD